MATNEFVIKYLGYKEIDEIKRNAQRTLDELNDQTIKSVHEGPCDERYPCGHEPSKCWLILNNGDTVKIPYTDGMQIALYLRELKICTPHFDRYLDGDVNVDAFKLK